MSLAINTLGFVGIAMRDFFIVLFLILLGIFNTLRGSKRSVRVDPEYLSDKEMVTFTFFLSRKQKLDSN